MCIYNIKYKEYIHRILERKMMCIMHSGSLRRPLPTEGCFRYGEMNRPGGSVEGHQVQFTLYG